MKKKIITIAAIGSFVLLTAAYSIFFTEKNQVNSLMLENIEALAQSTTTTTTTTSDCHYINGFRQFSGNSGGGYDCCKIWRHGKGSEDCR